MDADFWHSRWQQNNIGFHNTDVNPYLPAYWEQLAVEAPATVFVPLCGKSLDIGWFLQQGYQIEAVELSPVAIEALIQEQGLTAKRSQLGDWQVWSGEGFRLWCGDYFQLTQTLIGSVEAVYDRAALVALPVDLRQSYVRQMRKLAGAVPQLLITLCYEQAQMAGPPFAVCTAEVQHLYGMDYTGAETPVLSEDVLSTNERFRARGVTRLDEHIFVLQVREK